MTDYFGLGSHSHAISTRSDKAQAWFDRGLIWCYGFNHEEAVRCFEKTLEHDPRCAMGYWGIAYASGSFYNKPWEWYDDEERIQALKTCYNHAQKARELADNASESEQLLGTALCAKHKAERTDNLDELNQWEADYADAMRLLLQRFPDDLDIICLTAESLMNLSRWKLWDIESGAPASGAHTEESITMLEHGLSLSEQNRLCPHPGIRHFYIHALEMSPQPERAMPAADQLRSISADSGHLLHMSTHIDLLCGQYPEAVEANNRAIVADLKYIGLRGKHEFYMISCLHDFHSKMYATMMLGQYEPAMAAAQGTCSLIDDDMLKTGSRYLTSTLEAYYSSKVHVLVRFGRWQTIADETPPEDPALHPITTTLLYYAKAIALGALGDIVSARQCQTRFEQLRDAVPDWHIIANNPTRDILAVAAEMMKGEVEYHAGNHEIGYAHLRQAIELCDRLAYAEPWPWMHPPRHALGALLLEQGHVHEAMQHYKDDLGIDNTLPRSHQHRGNIWALHGYVECLKRLGQNAQAETFQPQLDAAVKMADINISSSCCCRKNVFQGKSELIESVQKLRREPPNIPV